MKTIQKKRQNDTTTNTMEGETRGNSILGIREAQFITDIYKRVTMKDEDYEMNPAIAIDITKD